MSHTALETLDPTPDWWSAPASWAECRRLLPGHPWLGQPGLHAAVSRGDIWVLAADVLARKIRRTVGKPQDYDLFKVDRPAMLATGSGGPVPVADLASDRTASGGEVAVLAAGTLLRVADITGYWDGGCVWPMASEDLELALPGGTVHLMLETYGVIADTWGADSPWSDTVCWSDIMTAAVIVPASHPFAHDVALVAATLERIAEACGEPGVARLT